MTVTEVMTPTERLRKPRLCRRLSSEELPCWLTHPDHLGRRHTRQPVLVGIAPKVLSETGVCLDIQELGFGDIRTKISLSAPAGEGPDIFVGAHDWLGELTANGVVAPMDLGAKAADFDPVSVHGMTYDGTLYGLPYAVENPSPSSATRTSSPLRPQRTTSCQTMSKEMKDAGTVTQFLALQTG